MRVVVQLGARVTVSVRVAVSVRGRLSVEVGVKVETVRDTLGVGVNDGDGGKLRERVALGDGLSVAEEEVLKVRVGANEGVWDTERVRDTVGGRLADSEVDPEGVSVREPRVQDRVERDALREAVALPVKLVVGRTVAVGENVSLTLGVGERVAEADTGSDTDRVPEVLAVREPLSRTEKECEALGVGVAVCDQTLGDRDSVLTEGDTEGLGVPGLTVPLLDTVEVGRRVTDVVRVAEGAEGEAVSDRVELALWVWE